MVLFSDTGNRRPDSLNAILCSQWIFLITETESGKRVRISRLPLIRLSHVPTGVTKENGELEGAEKENPRKPEILEVSREQRA